MCYVTIQNVIKKTNFRLKDIVSLRHSFIYLDYVIKTFYASDYRIYNQLNGISLGGTG